MSDEPDESDRRADEPDTEETDGEETDSGVDTEFDDSPEIEFEPEPDDSPDSFADLGESLAEDDDSDSDSDATADSGSDDTADRDTDDSDGFGSDLAAEVAEDFGEASFDSEDSSRQPDVFADPEHVSEGSDTTHEERTEVDTGETGAADGAPDGTPDSAPDGTTVDPTAEPESDIAAETDVTDSVSDESGDRTAPLSELADEMRAGADAEVEDDPFFQEMDVTDADSDTAWDRLEQEEPFEQPDLDDGIEDVPEERDEHIVDKRKYCQQCAFLSEPPEVHCGHDGTEIVQVPDSEHFRVRSCPMIGEDGPNFDGASSEDDADTDDDAETDDADTADS